MRKIVDLCFYFLLKKKLGKSTFLFLVLDKETPLKNRTDLRRVSFILFDPFFHKVLLFRFSDACAVRLIVR